MAEQYYATGRRKASVARVYLKPGSGRININDQDIAKYFRRKTLELIVRQPLELLSQVTAFDVYAHVDGGGWSGQAGAVRLGIARCLNLVDERNKKQLREAGFLTRDSRAVERKKYGRKKARKRFQFSKRGSRDFRLEERGGCFPEGASSFLFNDGRGTLALYRTAVHNRRRRVG